MACTRNEARVLTCGPGCDEMSRPTGGPYSKEIFRIKVKLNSNYWSKDKIWSNFHYWTFV
jgi:hypothetical protein